MHQEVADIALGFLSRSVTRGRYPLRFQAAEHALHWRIDAPMSTSAPRLAQVGQNQWIQASNDVALQTSLYFLARHPFGRSTRHIRPGSRVTDRPATGARGTRHGSGSTGAPADRITQAYFRWGVRVSSIE